MSHLKQKQLTLKKLNQMIAFEYKKFAKDPIVVLEKLYKVDLGTLIDRQIFTQDRAFPNGNASFSYNRQLHREAYEELKRWRDKELGRLNDLKNRLVSQEKQRNQAEERKEEELDAFNEGEKENNSSGREDDPGLEVRKAAPAKNLESPPNDLDEEDPSLHRKDSQTYLNRRDLKDVQDDHAVGGSSLNQSYCLDQALGIPKPLESVKRQEQTTMPKNSTATSEKGKASRKRGEAEKADTNHKRRRKQVLGKTIETRPLKLAKTENQRPLEQGYEDAASTSHTDHNKVYMKTWLREVSDYAQKLIPKPINSKLRELKVDFLAVAKRLGMKGLNAVDKPKKFKKLSSDFITRVCEFLDKDGEIDVHVYRSIVKLIVSSSVVHSTSVTENKSVNEKAIRLNFQRTLAQQILTSKMCTTLLLDQGSKQHIDYFTGKTGVTLMEPCNFAHRFAFKEMKTVSSKQEKPAEVKPASREPRKSAQSNGILS